LGPINVEANATSSTTILVRWGDVPVEHQNGQIEGFKVYYGANSRSPFQYKNIPSNSTFTTTLTELRKFVQYHVQVLAYTRLGDGALSIPPIRVQTFEDGKMYFSLRSLNIFVLLRAIINQTKIFLFFVHEQNFILINRFSDNFLIICNQHYCR